MSASIPKTEVPVAVAACKSPIVLFETSALFNVATTTPATRAAAPLIVDVKPQILFFCTITFVPFSKSIPTTTAPEVDNPLIVFPITVRFESVDNIPVTFPPALDILVIILLLTVFANREDPLSTRRMFSITAFADTEILLNILFEAVFFLPFPATL